MSHLELFAAREPFLTHRTDVRLFPRVRPHVYDELSRLYERLRANRAFVGPFAGVNAHVPMQFPRMFERSRAHLALVRPFLRVDPPVHAEVLFHTVEEENDIVIYYSYQVIRLLNQLFYRFYI